MIVTSVEIRLRRENKNGNAIISSITSIDGLKSVHLYFIETGIIVLRDEKAPFLNGRRQVLFVHVPSGKIMHG